MAGEKILRQLLRTLQDRDLGVPLWPWEPDLLKLIFSDVLDLDWRMGRETTPVSIVEGLRVREDVDVMDGSKIA